MSRRALAWAAIAAIAAYACADPPRSSDDDDGSGGAATAGSGGPVSSPGGASTASTASSTAQGSGGAAGSTQVGMPCVAVSGDSSCVTCSKARCCEEWEPCSTDANCLCWLACKEQGNPDSACGNQCGPQGEPFATLFVCAIKSCYVHCF